MGSKANENLYSADFVNWYGDAYFTISFGHTNRYCIKYNKKVIISFGNFLQTVRFCSVFQSRFIPIEKLLYDGEGFDMYYGNYRECSKYLIDEIPYFTPTFLFHFFSLPMIFIWVLE
jgi:hypothetical protein